MARSGKIQVQVLKDQYHVDQEKEKRADWRTGSLCALHHKVSSGRSTLSYTDQPLNMSWQKSRIWLGGTILEDKERQKETPHQKPNCSLILQYKISDLLSKKEWNREKQSSPKYMCPLVQSLPELLVNDKITSILPSVNLSITTVKCLLSYSLPLGKKTYWNLMRLVAIIWPGYTFFGLVFSIRSQGCVFQGGKKRSWKNIATDRVCLPVRKG